MGLLKRVETVAKYWALNRLDTPNVERLRIVYRCFRDLRASYAREPVNGRGQAISVQDVRDALGEMGIRPGDVIHVHSSASELLAGSNPIKQSGAVVKMLIELVGQQGTVLMSTDALQSGWDHAARGDVFDYARWPSRRGLISEVFRRRRDVVRSVHPWYNVTGWGRRALELIGDHHRSEPYAMDANSPWYRLGLIGGKVVLLGRGYMNNSLVHLVEYLHPKEFPRAVFLDRPVAMKYMSRDRQVREIEVFLHAPVWKHGAEARFAEYLNAKYRLYQVRTLRNGAKIVCYLAKDQYEAVYAEMKNNVTWYDPQFWP